MADSTPSPTPKPSGNSSKLTSINTLTPPGVKPRDFTEIAIERGYCTADQIKQALDEHQRQKSLEDLTVFFVKMGILTQVQARACERATRGAMVIANFEILEKVGQGGMGAVFRAKQISMDRIVALKILPPKLAQDPVFKKRFMHEAKLSAKLSHMNIINGIDCGDAGGYTYFAMEYVDGKTIKQILKERGKLPFTEAVQIVRQMVEALIYAQSQNLVHRDIKPDNIMLTAGGVAKLCDLGLAKQNEKAEDSSLTQAGQAVGTPHYISPEQARGEKSVDTRSDIYALGGTFYHMLTGKTPFDAPTSASVMAMHITDEAKSPCELDPAVPVAFGEIVSKMMAKSPAERYLTAQELIEDLDAANAKQPTKASTFRARTSCATPRRVSRNTTGPQTPVSERRQTTGKHSPTASSMTSFGAAAAIVFMVGIGGYFYFTQYSGKKIAQVPPVVPKEVKPDVPKNADPAPPKVTPEPDKKIIVIAPPDKTTEPKPIVEIKKPEETKKPPDKVAVVAPPPNVVSSKRVPPPPPEMEAPQIELTADMLYSRFLSEMPKFTAHGDLNKAQSDMRELSNKAEFSVARADVNAELADYAVATSYEQNAIKAMAAAGGMVDLKEETAKKWETSKGKIIGADPNKGLMVEIDIKGNKIQLPVPASSIPLADIVKVSPDRSSLGQMRYLSARGNYKDAAALLPKVDGAEKPRWERKLKLAQNGEKELMALAAFNNLGKVAAVRSWKTYLSLAEEYEKSYLDTSAASENLVAFHEWKSAAKAALVSVEGLEATGKFSSVKWPGVNASKAEVKTSPEFGNKLLVITGEAAVEEAAKVPEPPREGEKPKPVMAEHDKVGVMRLSSDTLDLTEKNVISFRTHHKNDAPLQVAIGLLAGEQYVETPKVSVASGDWFENTIHIDGATFKSAINNFQTYDQEMTPRDKIRGLVIVVYTKEAFTLEMDSIQFKQEKPPALKPAKSDQE